MEVTVIPKSSLCSWMSSCYYHFDKIDDKKELEGHVGLSAEEEMSKNQTSVPSKWKENMEQVIIGMCGYWTLRPSGEK
ncbi:uncharacterized protein LOC119820906 isoform X6 [Arvicola amphibius]|uniref:uncharacterized protein LOC119820906 isoform X6 n=1 Tax=Arvicola amphibius TaxID=1047088 RepID=UPI001C099574|nr:uncharacterized protein LOC119820906 isoform X6 [Arvicola amphibius]